MNSQGVDASVLQIAGHEILGWWIVTSPEDFSNLTAEGAESFLGSAALDAVTQRQVIDALADIGWDLDWSALPLATLDDDDELDAP